MTSRIAIVGSRDWPATRLVEVELYVADLPAGTIIISGGARGPDGYAAHTGQRCGLAVVEHLPDYATHGRRAPLVRNELIAADCTRMVAYWDGASRGTAHVACARRLGKVVEVRG